MRVFNGKRSASTYSSDFSREGLDRMLNSALELAKITSEDPFCGIPEPAQLGSLSGDLDLYSADVYSLPGEERIDYARRAESAALAVDPRIKNSEGGSFDAATGHKVLANSHGFVGEYRRSYCSVSAVPIAQTENGGMQRDYWYSVARSIGRLESPEHVGKVAAERTLRRLGARKVKTAHVPIIFDPTGSRFDPRATFSKASTVIRSIAAHHFWRESLGKKLPLITSPSSTTAPWSVVLVPARSMGKASPLAVPWSSKTAC